MESPFNNAQYSLEKLKPSIESKCRHKRSVCMYSFYCKLSLKSKSAELLIATERHELDRAALDKQLLSRERELIHCKEQLAKEKQVILRVARVVSVNMRE